MQRIGRILWLESRGHALMVDGVPSYLRGLTIDITARKKNEEALVASEARYRVLADLNPQGIWMGDPAGNVTYANQALLDYLASPSKTSRPRAGSMPSTLMTASVFSSPGRAPSLTGDDYDIEARMIRARDGRARWWWLRAQPVRDESGKILHWLGVAIDIDDRKTFAETLQQPPGGDRTPARRTRNHLPDRPHRPRPL